MKTIYIESLAAARKKMKEMCHVKMSILFKNLNEKPIAAWVYDGYRSGVLVTQADISKNPEYSLGHNFNGNQVAFNILRAATLERIGSAAKKNHDKK